MSLITNNPPRAPGLDEKRARLVLSKVDQVLDWERQTEGERDTRFVELGRYLCEVRAGQYWRLERLASFDDYLQRRFPESRRKAYYLMSIHEQLPKQVRYELKQVGWSKAAELAKVAHRDGERFESATWLHRAQTMPKQEFKCEVDKYLTEAGEASKRLYFKLYESQVPVIEQALETAARMLGSDGSRGYCLELICGDFLAGADPDPGNAETLLRTICRLFHRLPGAEQDKFFRHLKASAGGRKTTIRLGSESTQSNTPC